MSSSKWSTATGARTCEGKSTNPFNPNENGAVGATPDLGLRALGNIGTKGISGHLYS